MRNSISPFYDVCNCFIICHLITRILAAELNYRFTNSKTSLAIVIQCSLQEKESRNVSSELVHYNHKVLAIYTHWQTARHTDTHTPSLINSQMAIEPDALERWRYSAAAGNTLISTLAVRLSSVAHHELISVNRSCDPCDGLIWASFRVPVYTWCVYTHHVAPCKPPLTVAHTAHVTWVRHHVTHHTLLHHLSLRWLARIKVNFTYFSLIKVNICQTVGVKHILDYK